MYNYNGAARSIQYAMYEMARFVMLHLVLLKIMQQLTLAVM